MTRKFLVPIVLPADPTAALEAATKQYVDGRTSPPVSVETNILAAAGPTSGTIALTLVSITTPTYAATTKVLITASYYSASATVAGDTFLLGLFDGATRLNAHRLTAAGIMEGRMIGFVTDLAAGAHTVTFQLVRSAGTGTMSIQAANDGRPIHLAVTPV